MDDARKSLYWLRGRNFNIDQEIAQIIEFQTARKQHKWSILFTEKSNRKALFIVLGLITAYQMSGITVVITEAANIFRVYNICFISNTL